MRDRRGASQPGRRPALAALRPLTGRPSARDTCEGLASDHTHPRTYAPPTLPDLPARLRDSGGTRRRPRQRSTRLCTSFTRPGSEPSPSSCARTTCRCCPRGRYQGSIGGLYVCTPEAVGLPAPARLSRRARHVYRGDCGCESEMLSRWHKAAWARRSAGALSHLPRRVLSARRSSAIEQMCEALGDISGLRVHPAHRSAGARRRVSTEPRACPVPVIITVICVAGALHIVIKSHASQA